MDSSEYQVTIKSANQKVDDYMTKCRPDWTVQRLKKHISETHVNKPAVEDQRLIYAGNLLKDTHTLKQIFFRDSLCTELTNSEKTDFTIHLVCYTLAPKSTTSNLANGIGKQATNSSRPTTSAPTFNSPSSSTPTGSAISTTTNHQTTSRHTANISTPSQQQAPIDRNALPNTLLTTNINSTLSLGGQSSSATQTTSQQAEMVRNLMQSDQMRQQMAAFQQLAYIVAAQIVDNISNNNLGSLTTNNDQISHQANAPGVGEPGQFEFGVQPAQVVDQPVLQPDQEAPIMQHDVIDWFYYSMRAAILMAALYIHASMFRLLFIVGLLAIAFFFNRRSARRAQANHRQNHQQPPQDHAVGQHQQAAQGGGELRRRNPNRDYEAHENGDQLLEQHVEGTPQAQDEVAPGRVPFLKLCYLVITDFLASLVPE